MNEIILLKLGELVLKGLNRRSFEDKLQANIHRRLHPYGQFRVYTRQSATYVEPKDDSCDVRGAYEALTKVFGIAGLSLARPCEKDKDAILACARDFLDEQLRTARTFKVETKRADKSFPMTSIQLSQYVGGELHEAYGNLEVDVHHPELTVYIEVRDYAAYVHAQPQPGAGGLPVGINGRAVSPAVRRHRQPGCLLDDRQAGGGPGDGAFLLLPLHLPGGQGEGAGAGPPAHPLHRPPHRPCGALHRHSGGAAPLLPRGAVHHHHAPLYDAHFPGGGQAVRRQGPGHRRVPGTGGQPDHGRHAGHRLRGGAAHPTALHRDGQGGDRSDRPEDRHL